MQQLPWWSVVKNPPANVGDMSTIWVEKIPHAKEQLSLCTRTIEPAL